MNVPNLLSLLRLVMVPVFAVVFFGDDPNAHQWRPVVFQKIDVLCLFL